ncbi:MAG TPA: metallophosphoesterase [Deinococcales bacterium]|nr:metallophosphoesterase [Deinococcales bacterium]
MRLLAIGDPHLSGHDPKPMSVFGGNWSGHPQAFFDRWRATVLPTDTVIVAGDISWAVRLPEAMVDLEALAGLPGEKVLLRGNHDYWWPSIGRLRAALPAGMRAIQNDSLLVGRTAVLGTRGWVVPGAEEFSADDARLFEREVERLRLSIATLERLDGQYDRTVLALHYPPVNPRHEANGLTDLVERLQPAAVVYGHVHNTPVTRMPSDWKGTPLLYVAADAVRFEPQVVLADAG